MLTVGLPPNFDRAVVIRRFISEVVDPHTTEPRSDEIAVDFAGLRWIEGDGITCLSNVFEWLKKRRVRLRFLGLGNRTQAIHYLDDSRFFETYLGRKLSPIAQVRRTTIPLHRVAHADSHMWLHSTMLPWIVGRFGGSEEAYAELTTCMYEVFNNIQDHSTESIGCAFVQHHPNLNRLTIAISDFGIGIPASMRVAFPKVADSEALELACSEGVTSKKGGRNLGAGLPLLLQNAVVRNGGTVRIDSNYGVLDAMRSSEGSLAIQRTDVKTFYPGTMLRICLEADELLNLDVVREDLQW